MHDRMVALSSIHWFTCQALIMRKFTSGPVTLLITSTCTVQNKYVVAHSGKLLQPVGSAVSHVPKPLNCYSSMVNIPLIKSNSSCATPTMAVGMVADNNLVCSLTLLVSWASHLLVVCLSQTLIVLACGGFSSHQNSSFKKTSPIRLYYLASCYVFQ